MGGTCQPQEAVKTPCFKIARRRSVPEVWNPLLRFVALGSSLCSGTGARMFNGSWSWQCRKGSKKWRYNNHINWKKERKKDINIWQYVHKSIATKNQPSFLIILQVIFLFNSKIRMTLFYRSFFHTVLSNTGVENV